MASLDAPARHTQPLANTLWVDARQRPSGRRTHQSTAVSDLEFRPGRCGHGPELVGRLSKTSAAACKIVARLMPKPYGQSQVLRRYVVSRTTPPGLKRSRPGIRRCRNSTRLSSNRGLSSRDRKR